jgi:hypothetical protein
MFAYAEKQALFGLIFCERKTRFQLKKTKLKSTDYKPAEQGHNLRQGIQNKL